VALAGVRLIDFPVSVARPLSCLTYLSLAKNSFIGITPALSHTPELQEICLSLNPNLQLKGEDLVTLASLSDLLVLDVSKPLSMQFWETSSAATMSVIRSQFSSLELQVTESDYFDLDNSDDYDLDD